MPDDVMIAVVGVGGVVLGSVISTLPGLWVERRRAVREREAAQERRENVLREAGRLVAEELREAERLVEQAARRGRYWPGLRQHPTATWNAYRPALAVNIAAAADWASITVAYDSINQLNWTISERRGRMVTVASRTEGDPVEPEDRLREVWEQVRHALWVLDSEVGIPVSVERHLEQSEERARELWAG